MLYASRQRGPAGARTRPGAPALPRRGRRHLLIPLAIAVALAFAAAPALAEGLEEPGCAPWICRPATAGAATVEGTITFSAEQFELSQARFAYRTVQFGRETDGAYGEERMSAPRYAKLTPHGKAGSFKLSIPACSQASRIYGCVGGEYEGYATYAGQVCSEQTYFLMTVGEPSQLSPSTLTCTPRKAKRKKAATKRRHHR